MTRSLNRHPEADHALGVVVIRLLDVSEGTWPPEPTQAPPMRRSVGEIDGRATGHIVGVQPHCAFPESVDLVGDCPGEEAATQEQEEEKEEKEDVTVWGKTTLCLGALVDVAREVRDIKNIVRILLDTDVDIVRDILGVIVILRVGLSTVVGIDGDVVGVIDVIGIRLDCRIDIVRVFLNSWINIGSFLRVFHES